MNAPQLSTNGPTTTPILGIAYDDLGRRTTIGRASSGTNYTYDPVSRLASITVDYGDSASITVTRLR